ncbi:MAG TPA: APC family permease [Dehalococcoidia bacterium]|nr:APC family permease [Dehalococcoidia bacterium]
MVSSTVTRPEATANAQAEPATFRRSLTFFDVTNITVGAIIGADIYIAAAITAGLLGPASLLAWASAGIIATVLALTLAECARLVPSVGGPYAYVSRAFGSFPGFLAGWSMWIAELTAMPVFAIAFTNYLGYFVDLSHVATHAIRIAFLVCLTLVNVVSVRAAGRLNDALTALKLAPLLLLILGGIVYLAFHTTEAADNLTPFAPMGFGNFSTALVLVVWAYMGFELSTVPAGEVENPGRTIPRALATGMLIVTAFYLSTNLVLYSLVSHEELAVTSIPLVAGATVVFGSAGAAMMAAGAMVSVSGSDESDMLGASRLSYAMAADGLLPHRLAAIHGRFRTPYIALLAQAGAAISLSFIDHLASLISFAVFNLAFSFLLSAFALMKIHTSSEGIPWSRRLLPFVAVGITIGLLLVTSTDDRIEGCLVLALGVAVYVLLSPRRELADALTYLTNPEHVHAVLGRGRFRFLGGLVGWLGGKGTPP